jgi:hypothetical protein
MLDHLDGQHLTTHVFTTMVLTPYCTTCTKTNNQATIYKKLQYPTYVKDINLDGHIIMFKKAIKANGKIMEVDIINLFGFTFRNNIFAQGENFVQYHPNCTFEELKQAFYNRFRIVKNNEEVYMQFQNNQ